MTIIQRIDEDFLRAMKSKDEFRLSVMRLVRAALKNKRIDVQHDLSDEEATIVLRGMIKQYQDALTDFSRAGRQDLLERQQQEIDLIATYLPPALSLEEIERIVRGTIAEAQVHEVGKAMGLVMKILNGKADGNDVRKIVEKVLSEEK